MNLQSARLTPIQVVKGEAVARRQLSQWQWPHQSGDPLNSNVTWPHLQRPVFASIAFSPTSFNASLGRQHIIDQGFDLAALDADVAQRLRIETLQLHDRRAPPPGFGQQSVHPAQTKPHKTTPGDRRGGPSKHRLHVQVSLSNGLLSM